MNDEPNEAAGRLNEASDKMGVDSMANEVAEMNEAWEKGVGIEVDNIGEDNIDAGKMQDRKEKRNEVSQEENKVDNGVKGDKPVEAVDGVNRRRFCFIKKTQMRKANGIKEKTSSATAANGKSIADKETSMVLRKRESGQG
ncbi:hypothetical protein Tco_0027356 [Tanacetum coccineum]